MSFKKFDYFVNNTYDSFFKKTNRNTPTTTLCTINDNYIPGYNVKKNDSNYFFTHINYYTMKEALKQLVIHNDKEYFTFVETGCSAWGTKSTLLWDKFVNYYDGKVLSVDLNINNVRKTNKMTTNKTTVTHSDSLKYLPTLNEPIDFLYLDSFDVDFLNPRPSATHHLKEFNCVKHLLHKDSIILIDDTPISPEWLDNGKNNPIYNRFKRQFNPLVNGKGSFVINELNKLGCNNILHQYQTLWKFGA